MRKDILVPLRVSLNAEGVPWVREVCFILGTTPQFSSPRPTVARR